MHLPEFRNLVDAAPKLEDALAKMNANGNEQGPPSPPGGGASASKGDKEKLTQKRPAPARKPKTAKLPIKPEDLAPETESSDSEW